MTPTPDSSLVDDALTTLLLNDATLQSLLPDGIWWDLAGKTDRPPTRFCVLTHVSHTDVPVFGGRGYEDYVYQVKAVMLNALSVDIKAAAHRFDELLDDGTLTVPGYAFMAMFRESRIRYPEVDAENASIRWLHRGGHYRVQVAIPT